MDDEYDDDDEMNWDKFDQLVEDTVTGLREAAGNHEKIEAVTRRYLDQGFKYVLSPLILWDYFAISSPGIPQRAGYGGDEAEQMEAIFERLSKEKFESV